jgi:hypothetical protein
MRPALLSVFVRSSLLILACCLLFPFEAERPSAQEPERKRSRLEEIGDKLQRAMDAHKAAQDYANGLGLDGKSAKEAMDVLLARGFKCAIKLVPFGKSLHDIENCRYLDVSVSAKWQYPSRSPAELLQQAPSSPVDIVGGTCSGR